MNRDKQEADITTTATTAPSAGTLRDAGPLELRVRDQRVRHQSEKLVAPLSPEDAVVQAVSEASPAKWHIAHVTWFFEMIVLCEHLPDYRLFDDHYPYLFNSYYNTLGERIARGQRGLITRPTLSEVYDYRQHVDRHMADVLSGCDQQTFSEIEPLIMIGLQHEQQHQELLLTDIKCTLSFNPIKPVYQERRASDCGKAEPIRLIEFEGGIKTIGHANNSEFAYDNESPQHEALLQDFALADRPVTCGEFLHFIEFEWETASHTVASIREGNYSEDENYHPLTAQTDGAGLRQMFGNVWEWTRSHYSPYPGYSAQPGALGEYNGKFMCNQFVLRGGSCATPRSHIRRTYRNFWAPETRFQFSGIRLAEDR